MAAASSSWSSLAKFGSELLLAKPTDAASCDSDGFRDAMRDVVELSASQNSPSLSGDDA
jgi:hypothetical protein